MKATPNDLYLASGAIERAYLVLTELSAVPAGPHQLELRGHLELRICEALEYLMAVVQDTELDVDAGMTYAREHRKEAQHGIVRNPYRRVPKLGEGAIVRDLHPKSNP